MGGPAKFEECCTIGRLHLTLPREFELRMFDAKRERHASPVGLAPEEISACWCAPGGRAVFAHYWPGSAPGREAPAALREWECEVAKQRVRVVETENFMGVAGRVLAAEFRIEQDGEYVIFATGLPAEAFEAVLQSIRLE